MSFELDLMNSPANLQDESSLSLKLFAKWCTVHGDSWHGCVCGTGHECAHMPPLPMPFASTGSMELYLRPLQVVPWLSAKCAGAARGYVCHGALSVHGMPLYLLQYQ